MKTFIPFGLVLNVIKAPFGSLQRCQLCKEMIQDGNIAIVNNGDERMQWMFTVAHLECFQKLIEQRFQRLPNEAVSVTPKISPNGPRVEVNVGTQSFNFTPENANALGQTLILSAVAITFDHWAYETLRDEGIHPLGVLGRMRELRMSKTINGALLGDHVYLLTDCWNMFFECLVKECGSLPAEVIKRLEAAFRERFNLNEEGPIQ